MAGNPNWKKGMSSPNPNGRPAGTGLAALARKIRDATGCGDELLEFYLSVFRGAEDKLGKIPDYKLRMEAATWLANRLWGKEVTPIDLTTSEGGPRRPKIDFTALTEAELEVFERAAARTLEQQPIDVDGVEVVQ